MYFSFIPFVKYDNKPIKYPFSESDFTIVKNFFRRYKVNEDAFSYAVLFKKYSLKDGERLDGLALKAYGNQFYDWVIALTNNMINPIFDLPLSSSDLRKFCEKQYDNPYEEVHHYETIQTSAGYESNNLEVLALRGGLIVDESFYNTPFKFWNGTNVTTVNGNEVSRPVSIFEYEERENEKKREIYLLKPKYLNSFLEDFRKTNLYKESTDRITNKLKKTGV